MDDDYKIRLSIKRAQALLGEPGPEDDVLVLKLVPEGGAHSCCCLRCWPGAWHQVLQFLRADMKDEGDLLVTTDGGKYVLECHESGPEILLYVVGITAALNLIKPIIELVTKFSKGVREERTAHRLKLTKRRMNRGQVVDELVVEIDLQGAHADTKMIEEKVTKALTGVAEPATRKGKKGRR